MGHIVLKGHAPVSVRVEDLLSCHLKGGSKILRNAATNYQNVHLHTSWNEKLKVSTTYNSDINMEFVFFKLLCTYCNWFIIVLIKY